MVESTVRQAKDSADLKQLDHEIADAVGKLSDLTACFKEDAAIGRAVLPKMDDLKIGIVLGAMPAEEVSDLLNMLVAYPTPKQSHERTALLDGLALACVAVEEVGLPASTIIKLILIIILVLIALRRPDLVELVTAVLNALAALDLAAAKPRCQCGPQNGDDGQPPVKPQVDCGDDVRVQGRGTGVEKPEALLAALRDAERKADELCPKECPATFATSKTLPKYTKLPNGQVRCDGDFCFRCGR